VFGWTGVFLQVDLSRNKAVAEPYDAHLALNYIGGRGFAAKILWDQLKPGVDPLSPENKLVFAAGPLTGLGVPNSGKLVVAAKSPLTGGYGDGNIGTFAAIQMRKAGYDAIIIDGKAETPVVLHIKNNGAEFIDAKDFWGLTSFETEAHLKTLYGRTAGIVSIGPAGENLVKFAVVVSQEGRAGGRAGMGAVMGSKNLKAIVFEGYNAVPVAYPKRARVVCRFPNTSLDFELEWYTKYLQAATGRELPFNALIYAADKTLNLIRAFWIREYGNNWTKEMEIPPMRWFKELLTEGPLKGSMLDTVKFYGMLKKYYAKGGWDERGIPKKTTLQKLGLPDVAKQLEKYVKLSD
jgi:aldehyde:ferredoxin oxidoreductase